MEDVVTHTYERPRSLLEDNREHAVAPFWAKVAVGLASLVTVGFLAWAGVVWSVGEQAREMLYQQAISISTTAAIVEGIDAKLDTLSATILVHEAQPWHSTAGNSLSGLRLEMDNMRERMDRHEKELNHN